MESTLPESFSFGVQAKLSEILCCFWYNVIEEFEDDLSSWSSVDGNVEENVFAHPYIVSNI